MVVGSPTKLNLIPSGVMPVVYINQGDAGYDKEFLVYNGDSPYNVPAGVSATIRGKKADGYGVTEAAALTEGSNLVTVTITEQMVAAEGANLYELVFVDTDGLRIATINMVWAVKADALGDAVISESDLDYATQVMDQLQSVAAFKDQLDTNTDGLAAEIAARIAADATLQSNINTEASTRAATDTSLQAQINQIIAPSGEAPSAAEVQNARIGADGVTYQTLGEAIRTNDTELKTQLDGAITAALYKQLAFTLTMGKGVNPATGGNLNNNVKYAQTNMINIETNRTIAVSIQSTEYEFNIWCYAGAGTGSATYSPTNSAYTQKWAFVPYSSNERAFRMGIRRVDGADMTSTDESKIVTALKILLIPQTAESAISVAQGNMYANTGGVYHPYFRQGSGNFANTYYQESANLYACSTRADSLLYLDKGDVVDCSDLKADITHVYVTDNGIKRYNSLLNITTPYTVPQTGLYMLVVSNADSTIPIPVSSAIEKTTITHKGTRTIYNLPANPYKHIATKKDANTGAYTWSDRIHDIKSTCHLHTLRALYFTRARLAGYDHIAISNYHASKPTVPISEIITGLEGYDASRDAVPANWLESPNAEHVYFDDAADYVGSSAASHLHMNSVGSFITSGVDNTGAGEGGFGGTVKEFSEETERLLKYPNGGGLTINHPVWSGIDATGIINLLSLGNVFGLEIYNANCEHGSGTGYALTLWDEVLSQGWQVFGTAVPDHETEGSFWENHLPLGFVHLLCITDTEQEIMLAYRNGRSYCTIANDTLLLKYYGINDNGLVTVTASESGTITFVTATRSVTVENANTATFQTQSNDVYVRAEIETATNRLFTNAIML